MQLEQDEKICVGALYVLKFYKFIAQVLQKMNLEIKFMSNRGTKQEIFFIYILN